MAQVLGTPAVERWPALDTYPEYRPQEYEQCAPQDLAAHVPRCDVWCVVM